MKIFRVVCKTEEDFLKACLAVLQDNVIFGVSYDKKVIDIPDLEAYRTGLPTVKGVMKPRKCFMRCYWPDPSGNPHPVYTRVDSKDHLFLDTADGTSAGIWREIQNNRKITSLYTYINNVSLYGQYRIIFEGDQTYLHSRHNNEKVKISDVLSIDLPHDLPKGFFGAYETPVKTLGVLKKIIENCLTC